ncbi:FkbM family methyltransferase [Streptomyces sp. NPDC092307]|uniref:FkbM family methyltransferase n=1 Tax=Streptomyces sp. NPDC092307 TaxID=3366013 RepID=UPI003806CBBD
MTKSPAEIQEWLAARVPSGAQDTESRHQSALMLDALFYDLMVMSGPSLFVEAGAFEAHASMQVAALLPECQVVAFEANPYAYNGFSESHNYSAARVCYRNQALIGSAEDDRVSFFVITSSSSGHEDRLESYNSLLKRTSNNWLGVTSYEEISVPATTLDFEFGNLTGPFSLWMDVEGASKEVLSGAQGFLDHCDIAKIEVEDYAFWQNQWLVGDVVTEMARHGLEPVARDIEGGRQYNVLFGSQRLLSRSDARNRIACYGFENDRSRAE